MDVDALSLLKSDLKDEPKELCLQSLNRLYLVALAIGPERTRKQLLPFLREYCENDDDESMVIIATQLGEFVNLVGGQDHAASLFPMLEFLACAEETVVRAAAVESLVKVIAVMPKKEVSIHVFPMIKRMVAGEWFSSRVSASQLLPVTYPLLVDELQIEALQVYNALCRDETPMVRKNAFLKLKEMAPLLPKEKVKGDLLALAKGLCSEEIDSMRIHSVDCCLGLALVLDSADAVALVLPLVEAFHDDNSWKVRQCFARAAEQYCKVFGPEVSATRLLPLFARILIDGESEVRSVAASVAHQVAAASGRPAAVTEHFGPLLLHLATDENEGVRVAFAGSVTHLGEFMENPQKTLVPVIDKLAKDSCADVRNSIVNGIDSLAKVLGTESVSSVVLPMLVMLSQDAKWRVRMEVISKLAFVSKSLGVDVLERKLQVCVQAGLKDRNFSIREKLADQIVEVAKQHGGDWFPQKFVPWALSELKENSYHAKMTFLLITIRAVSVCRSTDNEKLLLPEVLASSKHDIPNVRFTAAKALGKMIPFVSAETVNSQIKPALSNLLKDSDQDVRYFAEEALRVCEK